mgnify:CR=1 FL=1
MWYSICIVKSSYLFIGQTCWKTGTQSQKGLRVLFGLWQPVATFSIKGMWYGYLIQIEAAVIEEIILWTVFCCQEVGSQIIESAIPRRISEVGPIRIWNFMFSTDFICEGVHSKITARGCRSFIGGNTWGFFHIRRSHGVGNHDFFIFVEEFCIAGFFLFA